MACASWKPRSPRKLVSWWIGLNVRLLTLPAGSDVVASTLRSGSTCEYFESQR